MSHTFPVVQYICDFLHISLTCPIIYYIYCASEQLVELIMLVLNNDSFD